MERVGLGRSGVENLAASRPEAGVVRIIARIDESLSAQLRAPPTRAMPEPPRAVTQCGIGCPGLGPQMGARRECAGQEIANARRRARGGMGAGAAAAAKRR